MTTSNCADVEYELTTRAGRPLTPSAAAHLDSCEACQSAQQLTARIDAVLTDARAWEPPPHFARTIGLQGVGLVGDGRSSQGFLAWWPHIELAAVLGLVWMGAVTAVPLLEPIWTGAATAATSGLSTWLWVLAAGWAAWSFPSPSASSRTRYS